MLYLIPHTGLEEASMEHTSTTGTGNDCPVHCIYCNGITVGAQSLTGTLPSISRKRTLEDTDMSSSTLPPHNNTDIHVLR